MCRAALASTEDWTTTNTVLQLSNSALLMVDWAQTRQMIRNPCFDVNGEHKKYAQNCSNPHHESGPAKHFVGEHPSIGQVNVYFAGSLVANYLITRGLPGPWREVYQVGFSVYELGVVQNNWKIGIRVSFPL